MLHGLHTGNVKLLHTPMHFQGKSIAMAFDWPTYRMESKIERYGTYSRPYLGQQKIISVIIFHNESNSVRRSDNKMIEKVKCEQ